MLIGLSALLSRQVEFYTTQVRICFTAGKQATTRQHYCIYGKVACAQTSMQSQSCTAHMHSHNPTLDPA